MDQGRRFSYEDMYPQAKQPRYDDGPFVKTSFFNSSYDPIHTQNRILIPHEKLPLGLAELKNDLFMWIDPLQGNADDSHKLFGFIQSQIKSLGRIDTVRYDAFQARAFLPGGAVIDEAEAITRATALAVELNAASDTYGDAWKPKNYNVLDIFTSDTNRFFIREIRKWRGKMTYRFRLAGLIQYSPVDKYNLGSILNMSPVLNNGEWTTHLTGKADAKNIWGEELGVEPRMTNYVGFSVKFSFHANNTNPGVIDVIPHLVPVATEDKEKRLCAMDYYCATVDFNRHTNDEQFDASGPTTTIRLNLDMG